MKYVVSGYIGFDNFGDEAIAHVLSQTLKNNGADEVTMISANPSKTEELHNVKACGRFDFVNAIKKADVLISGGGSLLQDVTSLKSLVYYLAVICTALLLKKRVEIFAQGIGPVNSAIGKLMLKSVLRKVDKITVRDKKSYELLEGWGIKSEIVKDPVFDIEIPLKHNKGIVGVQLRKCIQLSERKDFIQKLAEELSAKFSDKKFEIISLQDSYDLEVCKDFCSYLNRFGIKDVTLRSDLSINDVIERISNFEYLFGMRFHANVIGIKSEVITIPINYDPKVQKLAEEYNLPLIEIDGTNFREVFDNIN